jgi:hypothetical protein
VLGGVVLGVLGVPVVPALSERIVVLSVALPVLVRGVPSASVSPAWVLWHAAVRTSAAAAVRL